MEVRNLLSHCLVLISLVTPLIGLKITSLSAPSVETSPSLVAEASIAFIQPCPCPCNKKIRVLRNLLSHCLVLIRLVTPLDRV